MIIAASDLKLTEHFEEFIPTTAEKEWLEVAIKQMFSRCDQGERQLMRPISISSGSIMAKLATMMSIDPDDLYSPAIVSETDLRYAIVDPIVEMLCNCWGYQVTNFIETFAKATVLAPTDEALGESEERYVWSISNKHSRSIHAVRSFNEVCGEEPTDTRHYNTISCL